MEKLEETLNQKQLRNESERTDLILVRLELDTMKNLDECPRHGAAFVGLRLVMWDDGGLEL